MWRWGFILDVGDGSSDKESIMNRKIISAMVAVIMAIIVAGCGSAASENTTSQKTMQQNQTRNISTTADSGNTEGVETEKKAAVVTGISVTYTGSTEAGTVLDQNNSGIIVTQTYDDGTKKETTEWTVETPATLTAGKDSTVTVKAGDFSTTLTVTCTTEDPQAYKDSCENISYEDIARNPDNYVGKNIHFYGQVIQVMEDGNDVTLRVATKKSDYGYWNDDVVLVAYTREEGESRILEDDMVNLYGVCAGTTSYETVRGDTLTIPSMVAKYVDIDS